MIASSVARPVARQVAKAVSAVGVSASLSDPSDPPPAGFTYLVDSDGAYIADSDNAWLLVPDTPGPDSIADLALWLRASDLALADNASVASWISAEGNNHDFVQATGTKQPTYKATSLINSRPAVSFDGGDILKLASAVSTSESGAIWFICRRSAATQYQAMFSHDSNAAAAYMAAYHRYSTDVLAFDNASTAATGGTSSADANELIVFQSDGSVITMSINGVAASVTDGTSGKWFADVAVTNTSIGGIAYSTDLYFFTGLIAELGVYDAPLTPEQLALLVAYANTEYGI